MSPLSPRLHDSDLNLEGSELMLRPSAPVYCLDLDPAALGSSTTSTVGSTTGGTPSFSSTTSEAAAAAAGLADLSFSSVYSGRRGYRLQGYAAAGPSSSSSSRSSLAQNATVPGLVTPVGSAAAPAGPADVVADGNVSTAATAAQPGRFWPGPSAGLGVSAAGTFSITGSSIGSSRGLLTGMPSGLGVGPGGLLVGPTAAGGGVGLRPRPKSSHTAAVESIARRHAALQVGLTSAVCCVLCLLTKRHLYVN
jgi:hypothetical protein